MARVKVQITTPSNNVIKVSPGVSALSSVQLYLNELIDVNSAHGAEGHVLTQQSDGTFAMEAVATTLSDLSDTNIPTPQGGDSLVYDAASQKWVPGGVKSVNGQDGDVVITIPSPPPTPGVSGLADTNITSLQDDQIIRYDSFSGEWLNEDLEALPAGGTTGQALVKATGTDYDVEWADIAIDTQYHNRFQTDAETFRSGATDTVELYYTAKADGDGLAESASSDTPTAGKIIRRKIYYSEAAFADPDTGTWVEFTPAPADDASFATVKAALLEYLKARTGGTVPISLKQTWEEVTAAPAFTGLLNETYGSGAEAAYSTRRLNGNVTDCMVIRRASDSTTTTIGFDGSGNISEADIISFCTGTTCTVYQWLDQSGNGNTATATASANEPTIYTGGALVKEGGKVAVNFDGSNDELEITRFSYTALTTIAVAKTSAPPAGNAHVIAQENGFLLKSAQTSANYPRFQPYDTAYRTAESQVDSVDTRLLLFGYVSGGNANIYVSGTAGTTASVGALNNPTNNIFIGKFPTLSNSGNIGPIQEVIMYDADKSGTDQTSIEENIGDYFTQNTPLLDTYSGAAAAYSLRLLDSSYVGALVEVYNGSSYADIGFDVFGELNTVALADHCGSNDGFVSKWYDQSGNTNTAAQTNTANMPKIYDGTTGVITENGKPSMDMSVGLCHLYYNSVLLSQPLSFFMTGNNGSQNYAAFFDSYSDTTNRVRFFDGNNVRDVFAGTSLTYTSSNSLYALRTAIVDSTNSSVHFNGSQKASGDAGTNDYRFGRIGNWNGSNGTQLLRLQEFIIYESNQSSNRTNIETNINTFYNIYS